MAWLMGKIATKTLELLLLCLSARKHRWWQWHVGRYVTMQLWLTVTLGNHTLLGQGMASQSRFWMWFFEIYFWNTLVRSARSLGMEPLTYWQPQWYSWCLLRQIAVPISCRLVHFELVRRETIHLNNARTVWALRSRVAYAAQRNKQK